MQCQTFTLRLSNTQDLERLNQFLAQIMPIQVSSSLVPGNPAFWSVLVFYEGQAKAPVGNRPKEDRTSPAPAEDPIFLALRSWRAQKAKAEGVPPYVIAHNAQLKAIAEARPQSEAELREIKGFGDGKIGKYGKEMLELLSQAIELEGKART